MDWSRKGRRSAEATTAVEVLRLVLLVVAVVVVIVIGSAARLTRGLRGLAVDAVSEDAARSESENLAGRDHHGLAGLRVTPHARLLRADAEFSESRNLDHPA